MRGRCILVFIVGLMLVSCEHADPVGVGNGGLEPTLASIQANIFNARCAVSGCHAGSSPAMGLDLSAGSARGDLVGVASREVPDLQRVELGNADDSYLVLKLEGNARIVGARMPLSGDALTSDQIGVIRQWIDEGAP